MKPLSITIEGFRSYEAPQLLTFSKEPGLYSILGVNKVNKALKSNGSGKSTVWVALRWLLFDKGDRRLKISSLQNDKGTTPAAVKATFEDADGVFEIRRTSKPKGVVLTREGGKPNKLTQAELEDFLGFNITTFALAIVHGQYGSSFFDKGSTEKLSIFSDALGLVVWEDASKKAADHADTIEVDLAELAKSILVEEARIEVHTEDMAANYESMKKHESELASKLKDKKKVLSKNNKALEAAKTSLDALDKSDVKITKKLKKLQKKSIKLGNRVATLKEKETRYLGDIKGLETDKKSYKKSLKDINDMVNAKCLTCKQRVQPNHVEDVEDEYQTKISFIESMLKQAIISYEGFVEELDAAEALAQKLVEKEAKLISAQEENQSERSGLLVEGGSLKATIKASEADVVETTNPYKKLYKAAKKGLVKTKESLDNLTKEKSELNATLVSAKYWVKEYKKIRLWLMDQALDELAIEINSSFLTLGLQGWKVTFDVERTNSSGGISHGFSVMIESPEVKEPKPWEAWSGGESQRLKLAAAIGLSNMLRRRMNVQFDLEVFDEPGAFVAQEGQADMISLLAERAELDKRPVWVISHGVRGASECKGTVLATKTKEGTQLTQDF